MISCVVGRAVPDGGFDGGPLRVRKVVHRGSKSSRHTSGLCPDVKSVESFCYVNV